MGDLPHAVMRLLAERLIALASTPWDVTGQCRACRFITGDTCTLGWDARINRPCPEFEHREGSGG